MFKSLRTLAVGLLFSAPVLAQNTLSVTAPGLGNPATGNKLQVNCVGGSSANVSVTSDHPTGETHYKAEWLMSVATLELALNKTVQMGAVFTSENGQAILIKLKKNDTNNTWEIKVRYKVDSNDISSPTFLAMPNLFLITEASKAQTRRVIFEWQAATGENTNNGFMKITKQNLDGSNSSTQTVVLNTNETIETFRAGLLKGTGVNCDASGAYHFDEFASYR